jgi:hypothetical protein
VIPLLVGEPQMMKSSPPELVKVTELFSRSHLTVISYQLNWSIDSDTERLSTARLLKDVNENRRPLTNQMTTGGFNLKCNFEISG